MNVGVVGLGAMGGPIAEHLVAAGFSTTVFDANTDVVAALVDRGATAASRLGELAAQTDVVLVAVPSDDDVRQVTIGDDGGLVPTGHPGMIIVISASVRPETCHEIAAAAAPRGIDILDAALTGGVRGAKTGQINLLVGGAEAVFDRASAAFEPWTSAAHLLGPLGAGQIGKTVNNLIHWGEIAVIYEALLLGLRLGVEPTRLREALLVGPVQSRTLAEIEEMRLTWWKKDIENAQLMAGAIGESLPVTDLVYQLMPGITVDRIARLVGDRDADA